MLELIPVTLNPDYRKKWNVHNTDFVHLYKDGVKVSDTLYRIGGMGANIKNDYFILLKQVEAFYSKDIMKMSESKDPKHLENRSCIIDKNGKEKVCFDSFDSPYLTSGVVYSLGNKYYNIETGECYCKYSSHVLKSGQYIFLDNEFDDDKSKCGVIKIDKYDGSYEIFH
jgi:hypothetical protein